jgi:hypothetical protein
VHLTFLIAEKYPAVTPAISALPLIGQRSETCLTYVLPMGLDDIDAGFMTKVLRASGVIAPTNAVMSQGETGVGMLPS